MASGRRGGPSSPPTGPCGSPTSTAARSTGWRARPCRPRLPLRRDTQNKVIAGVCAGIARRYGISRTGLRLAFVLSCVLPGPQFIAYLLLWIVIPKDTRGY